MKLLLKLGITALCFVLIFRSIGVYDLGRVIRQVDPWYLLPALIFNLLATVTASYRWYLVMQALDFGHGPAFYFKSYLKAAYFNQVLPTSIGGDAFRVLEAGRLGRGNKEAFYGVLLDRVVGLVGLLVLNLIANLAYPGLLPRPVFLLINVIAVFGLAGVVTFAAAGRIRRLDRYLVLKHLHEFSARIRTLYKTRSAIAFHTALAVAIHFVLVLSVYFVGRGVGLAYDLPAFLVIVPPVFMLMVIPVSLAGWGVREGGFIGLFVLIGADKTQVLSMSLIYGLLGLVAALPGLFFFLAGRQHREKEHQRERRR